MRPHPQGRITATQRPRPHAFRTIRVLARRSKTAALKKGVLPLRQGLMLQGPGNERLYAWTLGRVDLRAGGRRS
jgi:hypothetical protein